MHFVHKFYFVNYIYTASRIILCTNSVINSLHAFAVYKKNKKFPFTHFDSYGFCSFFLHFLLMRYLYIC